MRLYKWPPKDNDVTIEQYIAWYNDDTILCVNVMGGDIDTYEVLEKAAFDGLQLVDYHSQPFSESICRVFIKFWFVCGENMGEAHDIGI